MKRVIFILLIACIAVGLYATPEPETPEITLLMAGNPVLANGVTLFDMAVAELKKTYPDVTVIMNLVDLSNGSTMTLDAMIAAGTPPNVYTDTIVRTSKYMVPEYAADLSKYIDTSVYSADTLKPYITNGELLGLPQPGAPQGMAINLELCADVGYELPAVEDWTIEEFLELAALVKAKYDGEKWVTGMFAANQSGDYLINNWFAAFGCEYFADGYNQTTIKTTGGEKVYEFFQMLVTEGYVPPHAAQLCDDDYVLNWARGELAATAFFEGWMEPYFNTVIAQGIIDEPFDYVFYPFPKAAGVEKVPTYMMNGVIIVNRTGGIEEEISCKLAEILNSKEIQEQSSISNVIPTRTDARNLSKSVHMVEIGAIADMYSFFDVGLSKPFFPVIRPLHYPILQKVLNLEVTPLEGITMYEKSINEEL